jgi:poly(3-hydroxyalkanoate) synthetase
MQIIGMKDYWTYGANSKKEFEAWVKGDHEKRNAWWPTLGDIKRREYYQNKYVPK